MIFQTIDVHWITAMMMFGMGVVFLSADGRSPTTRALTIFLMLLGLSLTSGTLPESWQFLPPKWHAALFQTIEYGSMLAGIEWGRRVGLTLTGKLGLAVNWLFRATQIIILVTLGISLLFIVFNKMQHDQGRWIRATGLEFAVFTPLIGSAMICSTVALGILNISRRVDSAEKVRLRALSYASPFLLFGLVAGKNLISFCLALGLLFFLHGSIRYLTIQARRAASMRQFLAPEVNHLLREGEIRTARVRERREISVVMCDLRGFTHYARQQDSETVMKLLEKFYESVGKITEMHGGTVKDHAGDGICILVGAPVKQTDFAARAVRIGQAIQAETRNLIQNDAPELGMGVGIATGELMIGAIQGAGRLEYAAVGASMNLAARLCAKALDGEIWLDSQTLQSHEKQVSGKLILPFAPRPPETLKGYEQAVEVYALA